MYRAARSQSRIIENRPHTENRIRMPRLLETIDLSLDPFQFVPVPKTFE